MTVSISLSESSIGAVNLINEGGVISFDDCFPEVVEIASDGIVGNKQVFDSYFFELLFSSFNPSDNVIDNEDVLIIEPFPDIISDFMFSVLNDCLNMSPSMAKGFLSYRLTRVGNLFLPEDLESVLYSIFPYESGFVNRLSFLYSFYNHHESSRKLLQFIVVNELLELYFETGNEYYIKDIAHDNMLWFRKRVYDLYHTWDFSFNKYTYRIADLIFKYDKSIKSNSNTNFNGKYFISKNVKVGLKSTVPPYISYNSIFSGWSVPGELSIKEFSELSDSETYYTCPIKQDNIVLKVLKDISDVLFDRRSRWEERCEQKEPHYINFSLWVRNMLYRVDKSEYDYIVSIINNCYQGYIDKCITDISIPLRTVGPLLSFIVLLVIESKDSDHVFTVEDIDGFVHVFCHNDGLSLCDKTSIERLVDCFLYHEGVIPLCLLLNVVDC